MKVNWIVAALTALVPLIAGFIWYNPKVFGKTWIRNTGLREEELRKANMPLIFILTYVFSFMVTIALGGIVIHQFGFFSVLEHEKGIHDPNSEIGRYAADFMSRFGQNFRTFRHGALHGTIAGLFFAMPVIAVLGLFERKRFSYIAVNAGFWIVCLGIMGGILSAWL